MTPKTSNANAIVRSTMSAIFDIIGILIFMINSFSIANNPIIKEAQNIPFDGLEIPMKETSNNNTFYHYIKK
jgi:hypothetical protein